MIRFTDANSISSDDPIDIDVAEISMLEVNHMSINRGTAITLQSGAKAYVKEDIATVRKMIEEAKK